MCGNSIQSRTFYHGNMQPKDIPADFPSPEKVFVMQDDFHGRNGHFLRFLDCNGIRYSLLLDFNEEVSDCLENTSLEKMYQAFDEKDLQLHRNFLHLAAGAFMKLFWPYLHQDFKFRSENSTLMNPVGPLDFFNQDSHKLQLKTVGGSMRAIEHDTIPENRYQSFKNPYPDIRCVPTNEIELLEKVNNAVFRVRIEGRECALKAATSEAMQAIEKLHGAPQHPNVLRLSGVAVNAKGRIVGILTPFILGTTLYRMSSATASQKTKWKAKITDAVKFLHEQNIIWGDAKTDNIMACRNSDEPVLIDFEGGYTEGWVDQELCDTMEGDLQALPRILKAVDDMITSEV